MDLHFFDSHRLDKQQLEQLDEQYIREFFTQIEQNQKESNYQIISEEFLSIKMDQVIIFKSLLTGQTCLIDTTSAEFHSSVIGS